MLVKHSAVRSGNLSSRAFENTHREVCQKTFGDIKTFFSDISSLLVSQVHINEDLLQRLLLVLSVHGCF